MQADGQSATPSSAFVAQLPEVPDHELLCPIGRGAYGEVWMARNAIGTLRAVKLVHRPSFEREEHFEREFKGLLKFEPISRSHDGLVDILQIGRREDAGFFYYVMELADPTNAECKMQNAECVASATTKAEYKIRNPKEIRDPRFGTGTETIRPSDSYSPRTLRSELQTRGPLTPGESVGIAVKLASALEHLHASGLVHRDIKPSNIIFVNGAPKLADIGLVTAIDDAHSLVGTVGYIPPEGPGTPQADLYSLGKVLYEMAFGKERQEFPQLPPDLQSHPEHSALLELNEVILKACESDPRRRYQSAADMQADLVLLQHGQSVKRKRAVQNRWAVANRLGIAALILALLVPISSLLRGRPGHTLNPEALRLYQEGVWHYSYLTPQHHVKALENLKQAVETEPKSIAPYREMTMLYAWPMLPGITNDQMRSQKLQEIADKAFAVDPNSAEGHMALSWCRFFQRNWRGAEDEIQRALRLDPNLALAHDSYCFYLSMQMRFREARGEAEWAAKQPPVSQRASAIIAACSFIAERRFDAAIAELKQVLDLDPNFAWGHSNLGDYYEAQSKYVEAIEAYRAAAVSSGFPPQKVAAIYDAVRRAYNAEGAQGYFRKWIELIQADEALPENERTFNSDANPGLGSPNLACCYAQLGEKEKALGELEKHFDEPYGWHQIKYEPRFDSLHGHKRYKDLVKRAGLEP